MSSIVGQEIPAEHDSGSDDSTAHHDQNIDSLTFGRGYFSSIHSSILLFHLSNLPLQFIDLEVSESSREKIDSQENGTHDHPIYDLTVVAQLIGTIFKRTTFAQRNK